jgi:RNA polymerase primary sigma factor
VTHGERLTAGQERDLVIAAEGGDGDARRRLVEAFLPSIRALARRFPRGHGVERQDLIQQGVAGLLTAARRYDPARLTPFWAYASYWVRKSMQELVAELTRPVALSDQAVRALAKIRAARNLHLQRHGAEPSTAELVRATGFSRGKIETLRGAERVPRSLDEPVEAAWAGASAGSGLPDPLAEQAYERVLDGIERGQVRSLAARLDERERAVIRAHYGLGEPARTLKQIGGTLGVTPERARQIEVAALGKLRLELVRPPRDGCLAPATRSTAAYRSGATGHRRSA